MSVLGDMVFFVMFDSKLWKEKRGICLEFAAATVVVLGQCEKMTV